LDEGGEVKNSVEVEAKVNDVDGGLIGADENPEPIHE